MGIQLTIVPTKKFVSHRGCTLRLWEGVSSQGHVVSALVECISTDSDDGVGPPDYDNHEFEGVEWVSHEDALKIEETPCS